MTLTPAVPTSYKEKPQHTFLKTSDMSKSKEKLLEENYRMENLDALETMERLLVCLALLESGVKHYPTILEQLQGCAVKIMPLITEETENGPALQVMEQISNLIVIVQERADGGNKRRGEELVEKSAKRAKFDEDKAMEIVKATFEKPKVRNLAEIIGMVEIKAILKELVILPQRQPQLYEGIGSGNTVLFYGPPGTGKTKMAHAIAGEANCPLHCISASDVLSHFVGQTEKNIKTLFRYLRENYEYSILFIDEVDGLCRKRNDNEQEYTRRIKTELMCQISSMEDANVFLICATNCPWDLDTAILRRLEKRIYFPLPTRCERQKFVQTLCEDISFREGDFEAILDKTEGYSGSDLYQIVQSARRIPLRELQETKVWKRRVDNYFEPVTCEEDFSDNIICSHLEDLPPKTVKSRKVEVLDLLTAANKTLPTIPTSDIARYEQFNLGK